MSPQNISILLRVAHYAALLLALVGVIIFEPFKRDAEGAGPKIGMAILIVALVVYIVVTMARFYFWAQWRRVDQQRREFIQD